MQTRTNGSDRNAQRDRYLLVGEIGPSEQEQHITLLAREASEGIGEAWLVRPDIIPAHIELRERTQPSLLVAVMATEEVVGYAEQPGPLLSAQRVVTLARCERAREGLRGQVTAEIRAYAPREIAVDRVEMALK